MFANFHSSMRNLFKKKKEKRTETNGNGETDTLLMVEIKNFLELGENEICSSFHVLIEL